MTKVLPTAAAMDAIPMRGDPVEYRRRISDFETGYLAANDAPKKFIIICKDALAFAIATNTDASFAEALHIINTTLKLTDDAIYRAVTNADVV